MKTFLFAISVLIFASFLYELYLNQAAIIKEFNLILLLIIVITTALLAEYGRDILSRIRKIGLLELATGETINQVLNFPLPSTPDPFRSPFLSPEDKYYYEEVNDFLLIVAARGVEPRHMNKSLRKNYEKALSYAGRYSFMNEEYLKSVKLLELLLEEGSDEYQNVTKYFLAEAYFRASDYKTGEEYNIFIRKAIGFYEQYMSSTNIIEPKTYYNLAWAYDEIGSYEKAIENNLKAIQLRNDYYDSYYNIAASYAKWNKCPATFEEAHTCTQALKWLEKTPPETLKGILDEDEHDFDNLKQSEPYKMKFETLLRNKGILLTFLFLIANNRHFMISLYF